MNRSYPQNWSQALTTLVVPLALGLSLYLCLNLLIDREVLSNELLLRYLTGHPISRITTFLFFVGLMALLVIANNVFDQYCGLKRVHLELPPADGGGSSGASLDGEQPAQRAARCLEQILSLPKSVRSQYLAGRLAGALEFVRRTGSAAGIEDELKYLAELDHERQQRRYSLARIIIWATPMLGFLGTVLGISQALGGIQVGPENDFQGMLNSLRGSLFVAFDTTALALTMSMLLMFVLFVVERFELQLLEIVNRRAHDELTPLYENGTFLDSQTRAVERIGRSVIATSHQLVQQHAEQWQTSMRAAEEHWTSTIGDVSQSVRESLVDALRWANGELAESIGASIDRADAAMSSRWESWQSILTDQARQLSANHGQVARQIEMIEQLMHKLDSIAGAQTMLNRNLDALAATTQLHATLQKLADSIHRLKQPAEPVTLPKTDLRIHRPESGILPLQTLHNGHPRSKQRGVA